MATSSPVINYTAEKLRGPVQPPPTPMQATANALRTPVSPTPVGPTMPPPNNPLRYGDGRYGLPPNPPPVGAPVAPPTSPLTEAARTAVGRNAPAGGRVLRLAAGAAPVLGAVGSLAEDAGPVAGVVASPNSTVLDKVAAGSGAIGKAAATGAGVGIGTNIGMAAGALTGPLAPVAVPVLGALGGAAGGWAGNKLAGSALREGGTPGFSPDTTPAPTPAAPTRPTNFRGNGFNDPRSTTFDNTGPSRDFTNELASVPRELPGDLRSGVIFKTKDANGRTVYSGRDVGAGAQFVDGKGANLRGGGTVSTVPGMSREQIAEIMARPVAGGGTFNPNLTAEQNVQYNREVENAQRTNAMGRIIEGAQRGGLRGGVSGGADGNIAIGRLRQLAGADNVSVGTLRALAGAEGDYRGQNVTMRGQDINADVTTRGQDITASTALRGQDMDLQGRVLPKQMELAQAQRLRQMNARVFQQAGGDPMAAAEIAAASGMDPKTFLDMARDSQTYGNNARKNSLDRLAPSMVANEKGEFTEGEKARVQGIAQKVIPGWSQMSEAQQAAAAPQVNAAIKVMEGQNRLRNADSLWAAYGLGDGTPEYNTLPDFKGATFERLGNLEGALTPLAGKGDYKVRLRDGSTRYLPGNITQEELTLMKNRGAAPAKD